jgi:hypothetical protein
MAAQLSSGMLPSQVATAAPLDLVADPGPFVVVYDRSHTVLASSTLVDGRLPSLPAGVLDDAVASGERHVSWQPLAGVREAVVALPWNAGGSSGVVVAGTSLAPSESRSRTLFWAVVVVWLVSVAGIASLFLSSERQGRSGGRPGAAAGSRVSGAD